eukprot:6514061-Prorocentrum_lima.AAC.1
MQMDGSRGDTGAVESTMKWKEMCHSSSRSKAVKRWNSDRSPPVCWSLVLRSPRLSFSLST